MSGSAFDPAHHLTDTGRWVEARDLRVGDVLYTTSGRTETVSAVAIRHEVVTVYNLTVATHHTYSVGTGGILVHNTSSIGELFSGQAFGLEEHITLGFTTLFKRGNQLSQKAPGVLVESLADFSSKVGGTPWMGWVSGKSIPSVMSSAKKISFNLDGFKNKGAALRNAVADGFKGPRTHNITKWELSQVLSSRSLRDKTVFYRGGKVVEDPAKFFGRYLWGLAK